MQARSFAGVAVLASLFLVFAGVSHAGGMMHGSTGTGMETYQTVTGSPDLGSDDYGENGPPAGIREAMGVGTLPGSAEISPQEGGGWHNTEIGSGNYGENGPPAGVGEVFSR